MKKTVNISNAPKPLAPYSQAVLANGNLYISGQIAINPFDNKLLEGTPAEQTRLIMENIGHILKEVNMDFSNIVKCSIFMSDMAYYGEINEIYAEYFKVDPPAREAVHVAGLPKAVDVEISCIAVQ